MIYIKNKNLDFRRYGKGILFSSGCALNETSSLIFDLCDGKTSVDSIVETIYENYDCEKDIIIKDVEECIIFLLEKGLIEEAKIEE